MIPCKRLQREGLAIEERIKEKHVRQTHGKNKHVDRSLKKEKHYPQGRRSDMPRKLNLKLTEQEATVLLEELSEVTSGIAKKLVNQLTSIVERRRIGKAKREESERRRRLESRWRKSA